MLLIDQSCKQAS